MGTLKVRVERIVDATDEIRIFDLAPAGGARLPAFSAGAHVDVHVRPGIVRSYSLCGDPNDPRYTIAVKREPQSRGGSQAMHDAIRAGDELTIGEPRNLFALERGASHYVLIAGGIGITPLLAMSRELVAGGASFELQYFARSARHAAFLDVLSAPCFAASVHLHYGLGADDVRAFLSRGLARRPGDALLYLCGPRPFMALVEDVARPAWPAESIRSEYFSGDDPAREAAGDDAFRVRLARSGVELTVPAGKSIAQVLAEHDVALDTSCEQGICGTCVTPVLAGEIDHRDACLTDAERASGDRMCPCVSRARSDLLVLDL